MSDHPVSPSIQSSFHAFLEALPLPVLLIHRNGTVLFANRALLRECGVTAQDIVDRPLWAWFLEHDQEAARQWVGQLQRGEGAEMPALTAQWRASSGEARDAQLEAAPLSRDLAREFADADQVILSVRDVSEARRLVRRHHALVRISEKLHSIHGMDSLLEYVTQEVQAVLNVGGAMVLLADEEAEEMFFRMATLDDAESGQRMREVRFPLHAGVAGYVFTHGEPCIVPDTSQNPHFLRQVDAEAGYRTRNMLDVPIEAQHRRIGVLCAVNKQHGAFDQADVDVLTTIARTIALPLENARIHEQLSHSYAHVQQLNRTKDRVIHHLSHELKTPLSVVSASLQLLRKRLTESEEQGYHRILDRAQRNVQRIADMQYEVEDILREREYTTYHVLSMLLDACVDELDVLIADELGEWTVMQRLRRRVEELFGPRESISRKIELGPFVERRLERLSAHAAHRRVELTTDIRTTAPLWIPPDVLAKVIEGLVRNAYENTPDGSRVTIAALMGAHGPQLTVRDDGIGITAENQRMISEHYFPSYHVARYASRKPFDFHAGGRGFDLLRMQVFSERYRFQLHLTSKRCIYIPNEDDVCPGDVAECGFCQGRQDCFDSGGTTVVVQFSQAGDHHEHGMEQRSMRHDYE